MENNKYEPLKRINNIPEESPMLKALKEMLEDKEQFQKDWDEIKDLGFEGPTVEEYFNPEIGWLKQGYNEAIEDVLKILADQKPNNKNFEDVHVKLEKIAKLIAKLQK